LFQKIHFLNKKPQFEKIKLRFLQSKLQAPAIFEDLSFDILPDFDSEYPPNWHK